MQTAPSISELLEKGLLNSAIQRRVSLAGVELNILEWGDRDRPGLLFIHGGAAHAGWWRFIAPFLLPDYHCIAVDLSGHGDSAWRPFYKPELWCKEVLALVNDSSFFQAIPAIIGHSMGGLIAIRAAAVMENKLPGLIIIDSAVRPYYRNANKVRKNHGLLGKKRIYESRQQAQISFRLMPPQPCKNAVLLDFIAAQSIRQCSEGWTWKYDPRAFRDLKVSSLYDKLKEITAPTLIIRGQFSKILDMETAEKMQSEISNASNVVEIADAFHHIMLDQPVLLIEAIKCALKQWGMTQTKD
jgi:pimeloyl-ACP methyl ester carboxylesterase